MKIKKDTPCIFIRLVDYNKNNFIEEHIKAYEKKGYVWLLKMGKPTKDSFLKEVIKNGGGLITKATARNGNQFYFCELESIEPDDTLYYPDYYNEIFSDGYYDEDSITKIGSWFKLKSIKPITDKQVEIFKTISTNRSLLECGKKFNQVSQMHVFAEKDIEI